MVDERMLGLGLGLGLRLGLGLGLGLRRMHFRLKMRLYGRRLSCLDAAREFRGGRSRSGQRTSSQINE